jgi:hypothetical protein
MPWDIFGNLLCPGYCEVHPHIHEEYPCSLCIVEARDMLKDIRDRAHQRMVDEHEKEMYEQAEREHYEILEREHRQSLHAFERDPDLLTDKKY